MDKIYVAGTRYTPIVWQYVRLNTNCSNKSIVSICVISCTQFPAVSPVTLQYYSFVKILALLHMIESEGTVTVPNSALPVSNSISASSHVSDSGFQVSTFAHHLLQSKEIPPLWDNCRPCQSPQRREVVPQQKLLRAQTVAVPCRLLL